jgi:hypothetical protein
MLKISSIGSLSQCSGEALSVTKIITFSRAVGQALGFSELFVCLQIVIDGDQKMAICPLRCRVTSFSTRYGEGKPKSSLARLGHPLVATRGFETGWFSGSFLNGLSSAKKEKGKYNTT